VLKTWAHSTDIQTFIHKIILLLGVYSFDYIENG
jgi:hypothetical protein